MAGQHSQCEGITKAGIRCKAGAMPGSRFCLFHDPEQAATRQAGRQRGGKSRIRPAATLGSETPDMDVKDVAGVVALLSDSINRVRKGELDPKIANATGYLASVLLRALEGNELVNQVEAQAREVEELKVELEAIRRERRHAQKTAGADGAGAGRTAGGNGRAPDGRGDPPGRGGDPDDAGDEPGPLADDVAPLQL